MKRKKYNKFIIEKDVAIMYIERKGIPIAVTLDIEDVEKVRAVGSWHAILDNTLQTPSYYICHRFTKGGCLKLHRFVMDCPRDKVVDHINHNTLDNRKSNLKICTHVENQQNLRSCKTGFPGIHKRQKDHIIWVATISKDKKRYSKEFKTLEDAIMWRVMKCTELYGKEALKWAI